MSNMTSDARPEGLDAVSAYIKQNEESFLARLMDYVRHPSISAQNKGIREVCQLLVTMLDRLGMEAEAIETTGHPMVLGRRGDDPDRPTVLFYGHYDVQPPEPYEEWVSPPFEPTIRDGRIYARGVGDNKGQHFAQLLALESWLAVHGDLPCNVIFLLEGEEEVGSPHIAEFVKTHRDRLKADLVVTSDGPLHISGRPIIVFGVRGMVSFDLEVRTASRDTHSGNFGGVMPNAIWTLVHLLATMKTADGRITIDGLHDAIVSPTKAELAAVANLPDSVDDVMQDLSLSRLDAPADRPFADRLMFHPTLTINGLHGGYGGPGSKAVLPCEAIAKCDIRLVEAMTPEDVLDKVEKHVALHAPEVRVVRRAGMLPSKTQMDSPYAKALIAAVRDARGEDPLLYPALGGSLPDYVFTKILETPAFVVPYANADEANHAPNENLKIECFYSGIQVGAAMIARLGQMRVPRYGANA
ncbi:acetylornithine deacetylase/succinyl-diaminopimelate desuccinylase-like protein [Mesorhizobium sp. J18]|uniref:M20/M25/M40 family metallo-hydrolase n=1 Tax=Mesorhizobium sp. J18 TaxID=935263 RepID=UPI00119B5E5B|nr:M20/M25/M40 family metallo-hydrolase [Mesorhizobium sp. J18]TWH00649.1 acetylornithine deacetylase/succinyl-diaminopimelate desuccinylase-like protein [Mesorhizobium sp. J18]